MTKLTTINFKNDIIQSVIDSISNSQNMYYIFISDHIERTEDTLETIFENVETTDIDVFRNMLLGKKISNSDVIPSIRNIPYESNKVFAMYDDSSNTMISDDYYCIVDETDYYHVYKCLDNNMGANSTSQPTFSHISGANTYVYQTADGYRWKYMYTISNTVFDKFSSDLYAPFVANTTVEAAAVDGTIDVIKINTAGKGYGNYTAGSFGAGDLRYSGDPTIYKIANTSLVQTNGYYTDCLLYISAGTGSGQFRTINDFYSNNDGNFIVVNSAFTVPPENGSVYEINPKINITADGTQTTNAIARALINASSTNSVYRIEMLNRGAGYRYATANVSANSVVGVSTTALIRPILSPAGGHGSNSMLELRAKWLTFSSTISNNESNTIPTQNSFDKIGLLKNPLFANVQIQYQNNNGTFIAGEKIYKINPYRLNTNATINTTSNSVSCSIADFQNQVSVGDVLYLKSSNNTSQQLATVSTVTNSSHITINSNGLFSCTEVIVYGANVSGNAVLNSVANSTDLFLTNVATEFATSDLFIGNNSGAEAVANVVIRNDITKGFNTFIQTYKYVSAAVSGDFVLDEKVYQGSNLESSTANGTLYAVETANGFTTLYVANQVGIINTSTTLYGANSLATATISNKYSPELVPSSADILYLKNVDTAIRANTQAETFKITFEF